VYLRVELEETVLMVYGSPKKVFSRTYLKSR
jgi:hypothetical protein